jgi:hypothetical protein
MVDHIFTHGLTDWESPNPFIEVNISLKLFSHNTHWPVAPNQITKIKHYYWTQQYLILLVDLHLKLNVIH